ncbi:MAG: hypothetical protein ACRDMX_14135 [Solirubrobacteraceae bacterium]
MQPVAGDPICALGGPLTSVNGADAAELVRGVLAPTGPSNVLVPAVESVGGKAPSSVEPKLSPPEPVAVRAVAAAIVVALS